MIKDLSFAIYDATLTEWISFALNRDSLKRTLKAIRENKPLDHSVINMETNTKYLEKILREEVVKQFNDSRRPLLELILNSIDARDKSKTYNCDINIRIKRRSYVIKDNGCSLNLEQILRFLIIPFNTEKDGIDDIGRFGVGFLSNFSYCMSGAKIIVYASTSDEMYKLMFYSRGKTVSDLRMKLKRVRSKNRGTTVIIKGICQDPDIIFRYIKPSIRYVPSYIARIFVNKHQINDKEISKWYTTPVKLNIRGKEVVQHVAFSRCNDSSGKIISTSQGVTVTSHNLHNDVHSGIVSFPAAIQVVEGRDEFKIDDNYNACVNGLFKAYENYLRDQEKNEDTLCDLSIFTAELLAFLWCLDICQIPNIENIRHIIFGDCKYALREKTYDQLRDFFGPYIGTIARKTSIQAQNFWEYFYGTEEKFLAEVIKPVSFNYEAVNYDKTSNSLKKNYIIKTDDKIYRDDYKPIMFLNSKKPWFFLRPYKNLTRFIDNIYFDYKYIKFVQSDNYGESPFYVSIFEKDFSAGSVLYINLYHPAIIEKDMMYLYSMICEYTYLEPVKKIILSKNEGKSDNIMNEQTHRYLEKVFNE